MTRDEVAQAVFGAADGIVSTAGVIVGGVLTHARASVLLGTVAALAAAGAVSMAGGEYLADETTDGGNRRRALIMGLAMLFASAIPGAGYLLGAGVGHPFALVSVLIMAAGIATVRARRHGYLRGFAQTFAVLGLAAGAAAVATVAVGAG